MSERDVNTKELFQLFETVFLNNEKQRLSIYMACREFAYSALSRECTKLALAALYLSPSPSNLHATLWLASSEAMPVSPRMPKFITGRVLLECK